MPAPTDFPRVIELHLSPSAIAQKHKGWGAGREGKEGESVAGSRSNA